MKIVKEAMSKSNIIDFTKHRINPRYAEAQKLQEICEKYGDDLLVYRKPNGECTIREIVLKMKMLQAENDAIKKGIDHRRHLENLVRGFEI